MTVRESEAVKMLKLTLEVDSNNPGVLVAAMKEVREELKGYATIGFLAGGEDKYTFRVEYVEPVVSRENIGSVAHVDK